jgi:hypothetical protein
MKHLLVKFTFIGTLLVLIVFNTLAPKIASASGFNPSDLISDSIFENTAGMSAAQIDSFLNSFPSSCISGNNGFTTPDPHGFSVTQNQYIFGGNVSAGQAIYDIAQNYHINPQVILTTLQKEQSIPTGGVGCYPNTPNPSSATDSNCGSARTPCTESCPYSGGCMNIAMSYSCPDMCYAGMESFGDQISGGTWLLRWAEERSYGFLTGYPGYDQGDESYNYGGPMTPGFRQRVAGGPSIYYDGTWTTNDGTNVTITNGATASLYEYTPFANGNQDFVNIFESTFNFGDPLSGSCTANAPQLPYVERYYNARTYDHFYTAYSCDENFLENLGYVLEGPVFNDSPCTASYATPVYRYYNPQTGQHMWSTLDETQAQLNADGAGYDVEAGVVFCVAQAGMPNVYPVVRFYNPKTYQHFWAGSPSASDINTITNLAGYTENDGTVFWTQ